MSRRDELARALFWDFDTALDEVVRLEERERALWWLAAWRAALARSLDCPNHRAPLAELQRYWRRIRRVEDHAGRARDRAAR